MKQGIYALYDKEQRSYLKPFVADSDAEARRSVGIDTRREVSVLKLDPATFALHRLAVVNEKTGVEGVKPEKMIEVKALKERYNASSDNR